MGLPQPAVHHYHLRRLRRLFVSNRPGAPSRGVGAHSGASETGPSLPVNPIERTGASPTQGLEVLGLAEVRWQLAAISRTVACLQSRVARLACAAVTAPLRAPVEPSGVCAGSRELGVDAGDGDVGPSGVCAAHRGLDGDAGDGDVEPSGVCVAHRG